MMGQNGLARVKMVDLLVSVDCNGFHWVLMGLTGLQQVLLG